MSDVSDLDEIADLLQVDLGPPPLVGLDAVRYAAEQFEQEFKLPLPPLPAQFAEAMRVVGRGVFGTRADAPSLIDLDRFLDELEQGPPADYLLFGHQGHGVRSWAMHYYLVQAPLALFLQVPWGGAYMEDESATAQVARSFALAALLTQAPELERKAAGRWLVVVESDLAGSRFGVLTLPAPGAVQALPAHADPLLAALGWLSGAAGAPAGDEASDRHRYGPIWG